ncbi:MAG: calcium/sodium antiporter [Chitinophagales bacterium]|nr:calcium/sodium antiporter [Chitinophagales bacterium]
MLLQVLLLILGLVFLIKGAGLLVDGGSAIAKKYKVSNLAIGLTIVAFGTSAPELVVNIIASYNGANEIVFANVIGSNNFNLFLILGLTGAISPLIVQSSTVWKEIPISLIAALILFLLVNFSFSSEGLSLSRTEGFILILFFAAFIYYVYTQLRSEEEVSENEFPIQASLSRSWVRIIFGLVLLVLGGRFVVSNAVSIASALGVSEKIIGLTIIAAGTSLPELATSVSAVIKKNNDIAVGNIVGSNIFNIFFILGASSILRPIVFDPVFNFDIYILIGGTVFLFVAMFTGQKKKLDRWEAILLLLGYLTFTGYLIWMEVSL